MNTQKTNSTNRKSSTSSGQTQTQVQAQVQVQVHNQLTLTYSNRTEALIEMFAIDLEQQQQKQSSLLDPILLVVPNPNVETWIKHALARRRGIAANLQISLLQRFILHILDHSAQNTQAARLVDVNLLQDLLLSLLLDEKYLDSKSELASVRNYIYAGTTPDAVDRRRVQLSHQLAKFFQEYSFSRPDMLLAWPQRAVLQNTSFAATEQWQRRLWLDACGPKDSLLVERQERRKERWIHMSDLLDEKTKLHFVKGKRIYMFGISYVALAFQKLLARLAQETELFVYTLNPCMEFWEDLPSLREHQRDALKQAQVSESTRSVVADASSAQEQNPDADSDGYDEEDEDGEYEAHKAHEDREAEYAASSSIDERLSRLPSRSQKIGEEKLYHEPVISLLDAFSDASPRDFDDDIPPPEEMHVFDNASDHNSDHNSDHDSDHDGYAVEYEDDAHLYEYDLDDQDEPPEDFFDDHQTHLDKPAQIQKVPQQQPQPKLEMPTSEDGYYDPFALTQGTDTRALMLWGRPGRENIRLLNELSHCDPRPLFIDPAPYRRQRLNPSMRHLLRNTLLGQIQHDILTRTPERTEPEPDFDFENDESLRILVCPSIKREAETVAGEIWRLIQRDEEIRRERRDAGLPTDEPLRFNDIAVLVAGKDSKTYFNQLVSAFDEMYQIPYSLSDAPLNAGSRIAEAVGLLLELPFGRFSRKDILGFLSHPVVAAHFEGSDPKAWAMLCDALAIYHGADRSDQSDTYIDEDIFNWDQGLRRLGLGVFLPGKRSGEERPFYIDGQFYPPHEQSGAGDDNAAQLGLLARSLIEDIRFVKEQKLTPSDWAFLVSALLETYIVPRDDDENRELGQCLNAVRQLANLELHCPALLEILARDVGLHENQHENQHESHSKNPATLRITYRTAHELIKQRLDSLESPRGQYLAGGVVISTLQPMRAIPFRAIFVAGLSEGRFPSQDKRQQLDLRLAKMRAGDVSLRESEQYMFLETILCARDSVTLSYVAYNETTRDRVEPSGVVAEIKRLVRRGYKPLPPNDAPPEVLADFFAKDCFIQEVDLRRFNVVHASHASHASNNLDTQEDSPQQHIKNIHKHVQPETIHEAMAKAIREDFAKYLAVLRSQHQLPPSATSARLKIDDIKNHLHPDVAQQLAGRLSLHRAPPRNQTGNTKSVRLTLSQLRRFLECPLQGSAQAVLRLSNDGDDDDILRKSDEPFAMTRLAQNQLLKECFVESLRRRQSGQSHTNTQENTQKNIQETAQNPDLLDVQKQLYREKIALAVRTGDMPVGVFQEVEHARNMLVLDNWNNLAALFGESAMDHAEVVRIGTAEEHAKVDLLADPIVFDFSGDEFLEKRMQGLPMKVELVGQSELMLNERRIAVTPMTKHKPSGQYTFARTRRDGLRGFLSNVFLSALRLAPYDDRSIALLYQSPESNRQNIVHLRQEKLDPQKARDYLQSVIEDLFMRDAHDYRMPCEAVFTHYEKFRRVGQSDQVDDDIGPYIDQIHKAMSPQSFGSSNKGFVGGGYSSTYGPIDHPEEYPIPDETTLRRYVERRFGLYLMYVHDEGTDHTRAVVGDHEPDIFSPNDVAGSGRGKRTKKSTSKKP